MSREDRRWQWEMELHKIMIIDMQDIQRISLKAGSACGERVFDITIGHTEAEAIDRRLKGHAPAPPDGPRAAGHGDRGPRRGHRADRDHAISRTGTFYAVLHIRHGDNVVEVDCRPLGRDRPRRGVEHPDFRRRARSGRGVLTAVNIAPVRASMT